MIYSFIKIIVRNFWKYRGFSSINIAGLTIGLVCSILLFLYVRDEMSYDKFHDNYVNIYRIKVEALMQDNELNVVHTGTAVGQIFVDRIPEVLKSTRLLFATEDANVTVRYGERIFSESRVFYADSCFFDVFSFPLIAGDPETALSDPGSVVLTRSYAEKYFGEEDPLDKTIQINTKEYKIIGITGDCPSNSHFHYDILISYSSHWISRRTTWINYDMTYTYLVMADGIPESVFLEKSIPIIKEYLEPELIEAFGATYDEVIAAGNSYKMRLQPIKDIHLTSHTDFEIEINSSKIYVYFFSFIAVIILVLAAINFTNLSTARATIRSKEVGIRKVMGSSRKKLISQFLFEAILYSLLSMIIAMIIIEAILPYFNNLAMKEIQIQYAENPQFIVFLILTAIILGIFSGIYSALYLSSIKILEVIKGQSLSAGRKKYFRNGLVVFQFIISIILFISAFIIHNQLVYIQEKDLGYDKENIVVVKKLWKLGNNLDAYKNELLSNHNVRNVTFLESVPGRQFNGYFLSLPGQTGKIINPRVVGIDHDFINTFQIEMVEGRFFSEDYQGDSLSAVINESLVKELGLENPVGEQFRSSGDSNSDPFTIIGVAKNFSYQSLHKEVGSLLMIHSKWRYKAYAAIKVSSEELPQTISYIHDTWRKFVPDEAVEYYFLDQDFLNLHKEEFVTGKLFTYFSILSIVIACLGLLGLSAFVAERKTKEIGIRKANGADFKDIILLLIMDFSRPVILANIVAWPAAYFLMQKWLQKFAYHLDIGIKEFIISAILALAISWITIIYQSTKSAKQNPVDSLRYE
ncbi:MAG: ABC transporter permease [Bacteroidales bacterium]|nr:ABC transporter permease [Bacteroidales bacterium]